jgi:hypothetical protein
MFIQLISPRGEKVFVRTQDIRFAKVEKLENTYCGNFIVGDEYCYSEEAFDTYKEAEDFIKKILDVKDKEDL